MKNLKDKTNVEGIQSYTKMILDIIAIYLIGSMRANDKMPKDIKTYGYQPVKVENKAGDNASDADKARKTGKVNTISMLICPNIHY